MSTYTICFHSQFISFLREQSICVTRNRQCDNNTIIISRNLFPGTNESNWILTTLFLLLIRLEMLETQGTFGFCKCKMYFIVSICFEGEIEMLCHFRWLFDAKKRNIRELDEFDPILITVVEVWKQKYLNKIYNITLETVLRRWRRQWLIAISRIFVVVFDLIFNFVFVSWSAFGVRVFCLLFSFCHVFCTTHWRKYRRENGSKSNK